MYKLIRRFMYYMRHKIIHIFFKRQRIIPSTEMKIKSIYDVDWYYFTYNHVGTNTFDLFIDYAKWSSLLTYDTNHINRYRQYIPVDVLFVIEACDENSV